MTDIDRLGALAADEPAVGADEGPVVAAADEAPPAAVTDSPRAPASVVSLPPGAKDTTWLLEQDPDFFTLQLVTVSSPESASAFVARQREPSDFTVYQPAKLSNAVCTIVRGIFLNN